MRAPLAAGYLWLAFIWLIAGPHVPEASEASDLARRILELFDDVETIGGGIAVSFAAYLVGAVSQATLDPLLKRIGPIVITKRLRGEKAVSTKSFISLTALVRERVETATAALEKQGLSLEQVAKRELRDEALAEVGLTAEDFARATLLRTEMEKAGVDIEDLRLLGEVTAKANAVGYSLRSAWGHASRGRELAERGVREDEPSDPRRAVENATETLDRVGLTPAHLDRAEHILQKVQGTTLDAGDARYVEYVERALRELGTPGSREWETGSLVREVIADLELVATRLLGNEPDLFSAVDRLRSEAEFRRAIVVPMAALTILLTLGWHELWLLGLIPALVLFYDGSRRDRAARDLLVDALRLERVHAPAIEKFQRAVKDVLGPDADPWRQEPAPGEDRNATSRVSRRRDA